MHWILQTDIFAEDGWKTIVETLERFNIPYSIHKVVPFVGELIPDINPTGPVICFGTYSMRHVARERGWLPGVFDLQDFPFQKQLQHWGEHMLNHDSVVTTFENARFTESLMHVRPVEDTKYFAGRLFDKEEFEGWQTQVCVLKLDYGNSLRNETEVQVSTPKEILREYRFWIVDGEIVTASLYKVGPTIMYSSDVEQRYYDYVQDRIAEWQPLQAFVIDVCDTPTGIKIVEINTLNAAGFYAGDMQKLVFALEEAFNEVQTYA